MTNKLIGDVYGIVLNALQNWTIPDASTYKGEMDKFEKNDLNRKIHETNLKKIFAINKTIDLKSIKAEGRPVPFVIPQLLLQKDEERDNYYTMECYTQRVGIDQISK